MAKKPLKISWIMVDMLGPYFNWIAIGVTIANIGNIDIPTKKRYQKRYPSNFNGIAIEWDNIDISSWIGYKKRDQSLCLRLKLSILTLKNLSRTCRAQKTKDAAQTRSLGVRSRHGSKLFLKKWGTNGLD